MGLNPSTGMSEESSAIDAFLADHPRMIGVLFTLLLLLTQAGAAAAAGMSTNYGP